MRNCECELSKTNIVNYLYYLLMFYLSCESETDLEIYHIRRVTDLSEAVLTLRSINDEVSDTVTAEN